MKTTASKNSQKVILKNIAEKINKSLAIFNVYEDEELNERAIFEEDEVKVLSGRSSFFTGAVMESAMEVITAYRKKYENLYWHIDTIPVMKFDKNHDIYWIYAPQVVINFHD